MRPYAVMLQTDEDDKYLTESILQEIPVAVEVKFAASMDELRTLMQTGDGPGVILINDSSRRTGKEHLRVLKSDHSFSHIPVVILGEIVAEEYIREYYRAGANSYIIKPSTISGTQKKIDTFFRYWFDVATV